MLALSSKLLQPAGQIQQTSGWHCAQRGKHMKTTTTPQDPHLMS
jgi:hypothetical protein